MSKSRRERRLAQRTRSRVEHTEERRRTVLPLQKWEWIVLGGILLFGLVLRLGYLNELASSPAFEHPAFDAEFHDYWARCLVSGDWSPPQFHNDPRINETPFFRPPGYPYFLAGVYLFSGGSYLAATLVQMFIGLLSCVMAFLLARSIFGRGPGLICAALMSCYWIFIYFEGELLAPALLVILTLVTMVMLARWLDRVTYGNAIATGVLVGLSGLVRPNALVLAPVALAWIWWVARRRRDNRRFRVALVGFPVGVVLAVAPATIRNYVVADDPVLITSNAGVNLYIGNNEYTDCVSANIPILGELSTLTNWTCFDEPVIMASVEKLEGRPLKSSEVSRFFTRKALDYIAARPGRAVELMGKKSLLFWGPAEISNNKVIHFERTHSRVLRYLPGFPLALSLAIVGLLLLFLEFRAVRKTKGKLGAEESRRLELTVLLLAFVAAYFASYLPFFVAGRYRVPIIPVLFLFGGYGIDRVRSMAAARRWSNAAIWVCVFVAAYLVTSRQLVDYRPDLGMWHFDRGDAYRKQGKIELASEEFRQAVEMSSKPNPLYYNNLGASLAQLGRRDEAVEQFQRAIQIKPDYIDARRNLVVALLQMNRDDAAYRQLVEIVRLDPTDAIAQLNLGINLLRQSKIEEAIGHLAESVKLMPGNLQAQYYLARALAQAGRRKEAIERYRVVVKLAGDNVDAQYELADLLAQAGQREEAIAHLRRALQLKPDHEAARRLLESLESNSNPSRTVNP
jgi:tetratricopeptide (TPR) repeat protein